MDLELRWKAPIELIDGSADNLIYSVSDLTSIAESPGIYVFARFYGESVVPLYIGQAINLRTRIWQQLSTNVRLMNSIRNAQAGYRKLLIGEFIAKRAQNTKKALSIIESALINAAMVEGDELLNIRGTKAPVHAINCSGNRESRGRLPENVINVRRA